MIESVDGNNQEAFEPFALLCDLNSDTHAACTKSRKSAWVMLILSLAEDRCDFNNERYSNPQPGRFSDDTASTKVLMKNA